MPKLKPATIHAKTDALDSELGELQRQRQQLIDSASSSPLIGQYIATKKSGGTAFSGKAGEQAVHDYYALVDAAGGFICYVSKREVSAYRDRIRLGKKVAKLDRAITRCTKRINEYKDKLLSDEQTESSTVAAPSSQPKPQDNWVKESGVGEQEDKPYTTVESTSWVLSEAA